MFAWPIVTWADMDAIISIAKKHDIKVFENCSHKIVHHNLPYHL